MQSAAPIDAETTKHSREVRARERSPRHSVATTIIHRNTRNSTTLTACAPTMFRLGAHIFAAAATRIDCALASMFTSQVQA